MKGDYEEFHALDRRKNKANSKPIKANRLALAHAKPVPGLWDSAAELASCRGRAGYLAGWEPTFARVAGYSVIRSDAVRRHFARKICKKQTFWLVKVGLSGWQVSLLCEINRRRQRNRCLYRMCRPRHPLLRRNRTPNRPNHRRTRTRNHILLRMHP